MTAAKRARVLGHTLRARLMWLNTAVFATAGCAMLALNWISVRQLIQTHRDQIVRPPSPDQIPEGASTPSTAAVTDTQYQDFTGDILAALLTRSALLLAGGTLLAALLCWWAARRSLHRIGHVTAAARRINDGNLHDRVALTGPADEIHELSDALDAMLDRLDRSFASQRRFTAHASHELRTPLTLQRSALEIPLSQGKVPAHLEPAVHRALEAAARSERLIAALLTLARGESGTLVRQHTDLAKLAGDAVRDLLAKTSTPQVTVRTGLGPAPLMGDPTLLEQLVRNLVSNAIRHNHPQGTVHISTRTADGGAAVIEVGNTGPVITDDELPALFEPFRRGSHVSADARRKGSGLGLSVARAITDAHRGTLHAQARPAGGLTVRVELPGPDSTHSGSG
ncbi:sensor histidine kinase [Streptomyces sp. NPDC059002]|uniref:sensor histidine kinase n=1 Tax=Streptomyces sp. NPDC059002 TaxID=3346690 RepID=UPI0036857685